MENLFDALCCTLMSAENRRLFVEAEGVELMVLILRQRRPVRASALKALVRYACACFVLQEYASACSGHGFALFDMYLLLHAAWRPSVSLILEDPVCQTLRVIGCSKYAASAGLCMHALRGRM